jgi:hypothetical protein
LPRQLRHHIDIPGFKFLDAGERHLLGVERFLQTLFIGFTPGVVDQDHAGLFRAILLGGVIHQGDIDQRIDCRHAEHIVFRRAVAGNRSTRSPHAYKGHLRLICERNDGHRDRRIETAEERGDFLALHQFARGDHALGWIALVIAYQQFDLLAQQSTLGIDFIDRERETTHNGFARFRRLPGHRGNQTDLHRLFGFSRHNGERKRRGAED